MKARRSLRPWPLLPILLWAAAGCTGGGAIQIIPIVRNDIPPGEPLIQSVSAREAYYWLDPGGKLSIALQSRTPSLFGRAFDADWALSMVLEGLPAGQERLYRLNVDDVHWVYSCGANHLRCRSLRGVAVLSRPEHGRLRGRFHVSVQRQAFTVLGGWKSAGWLIFVGQFEAVLSEAQGRPILTRTEADGFGRPERPAKTPAASTRPSSAPATGPSVPPGIRSR